MKRIDETSDKDFVSWPILKRIRNHNKQTNFPLQSINFYVKIGE